MWVDPKVWAVTPKLFTWECLRARIVRGGVYERTGTTRGSVYGVLNVRDTRIEIGQSRDPVPQVSRTYVLGCLRNRNIL